MKITKHRLRQIIREELSRLSESLEAIYSRKQTKLLRVGSRGDDVVELQQKLKDLGADLGTTGAKGDGVDGQFGSRTDKAVKKFQADKRLDVDGVVGPLTAAALLDRQPVDKPTPAAKTRKASKTAEGEYETVLFGDSQTVGGIGKALESMIDGPVFRTGKVGARPSIGIGMIANALGPGTKTVFLTFGGNGTKGTKQLLRDIRRKAPNAKIVWMGPPPADKPSRNNSMVSLEKESRLFWKRRWHQRKRRNDKLSTLVSGDNITFVNAYDALGSTKPQPDKVETRDGIHVRGSTASELARAMLNASV